MMDIPPFFPVGSGPLVSILIPTRGRPEQLSNTIRSFSELACDRTCFEFLLKVDDDDGPTIKVVEELEKSLPIKKIVGPRGNGYKDLHVWTNQLCKMASGDWIWLFDDDATVSTKGWDSIIRGMVPRPIYPGIYDTCVLYPSEGMSFCCVRRKLVQILGHFSMDCMCDTWIRDIVQMTQHRYIEHLADTNIGIVDYFVRMPVAVCHTNAKWEDMVDKEKRLSVFRHTKDYLDSDVKRQKLKDCNTVLDYLEKSENEARWTIKPERVGWHIWRTEDVMLPVMVLGKMDNYFIVKENKRIGTVMAQWSAL